MGSDPPESVTVSGVRIEKFWQTESQTLPLRGQTLPLRGLTHGGSQKTLIKYFLHFC